LVSSSRNAFLLDRPVESSVNQPVKNEKPALSNFNHNLQTSIKDKFRYVIPPAELHEGLVVVASEELGLLSVSATGDELHSILLFYFIILLEVKRSDVKVGMSLRYSECQSSSFQVFLFQLFAYFLNSFTFNALYLC